MADMSKPEIMADAQRYANLIQQSVNVQRRGNRYKASVILYHGWKLAEIVAPQKTEAASPARVPCIVCHGERRVSTPNSIWPVQCPACHGDGTQVARSDSFRNVNGYDYVRQAWVKNGRYQRCGHPDTMVCGCYGREHMGEPVTIEALPDIH